jgi:hypothetical protein
MSVIKLTLTENHVKLLRNLRWSMKDNVISGIGNDGEDFIPPFGEDSLHGAIDLIINGKPENFNPFEIEDEKVYTDEEKEMFDNLYNELPTALEIVLQIGGYELGSYKAKWHDRVWKKVKV